MSGRILVVCPSWVGDAVMATPALRLLRARRAGAWLGALVRPGLDELLDGAGLFDEVHVDRPTGVLGPKRVAARVRPRRYDSAILLTNSFSTALIARIAGIPERVGYIRDGRGVLLTWGLSPPRDARGFAIIPAIDYYWRLVSAFLAGDEGEGSAPAGELPSLNVAEAQESRARALLDSVGVSPAQDVGVLIPGASREEKRWPAERFALVADHLVRVHGMRVIVSGSPGERAILETVASRADERVDVIAGGDLGSLKAVIRDAAIVVTNDTGPRHIAAAFKRPCVTLFGPTDHRWTTLRGVPNQALVLADPTLPETESANDHPDRCRIDRIEVERALDAVDGLLAGRGHTQAARPEN